MANGKPAPDLSASELEKRLAKRYNGEDFALCFGVRNDAGFSANREADAIGVGLWPSRGCHIHGFEVKASRADWLKELKNPAKAEAFVPYCDFWWIVAGSRSIVAETELPVGWGLLVPRGDGLEIMFAPKRNEATATMPRGMLVALLKRAMTQNPNKGLVAEAYERGKKEGIGIGARREDRADDIVGAKRLKEAAAQFQKETGINIEYSYDAALIAKTMAAIRAGRSLVNTEQALRRNVRELAAAATSLDEIANRMRGDAKEA